MAVVPHVITPARNMNLHPTFEIWKYKNEFNAYKYMIKVNVSVLLIKENNTSLETNVLTPAARLRVKCLI